MKHQLVLIVTGAALGLVACASKASDPSPEDASVEVDYVGETNNGGLPQPEDIPPEEAWVEDAGTFIIDRRCCSVAFQIPAEEPEEATGVVRASFDGLREGLPLTRTDAGWSASFCMPLNSVIAYRYEFTFLFDAGDSWTADDAGVDEDAGADVDGGEAFSDAGSDAGPVLTTVARASPHGYSTNDGQGGMVNIYQVAEDCGAADASVSLRP